MFLELYTFIYHTYVRMADGDLVKSRGPSGIKWSDKWHVIYKNSSLKRNNSTQ